MKQYLIGILAFILVSAAVGKSFSNRTISTAQADTLIKNHQAYSDLVILDVRTSAEFIAERIENAINLDVNGTYFNDSLDKLDKNRIYFVYCGSNTRSPVACNKMIAKNFKLVYDLQGGQNAWKAAGYPTVKGAGSGIGHTMISSLMVKIYPNPVVDLSTLEIDGFLEGEVKIEILNALGSLVLSQKMVPGRAITLNGNELSPGLYFYRLIPPLNQVKSGRFQVAR
jgi:rhodanese-related sulfurtransferase